MPDVVNDRTREILGRSLIVGATIFSDRIEAILRELVEGRRLLLTDGELLERARRLLEESQPIIAEHFLYTDLASWVAGYDWTRRRFPPWLEEEFTTGIRPPVIPPTPPRRFVGGRFGDAPDEIRFPKIEEAAKRLLERRILTREEFDAASDAARQRAFTITGDLSRDTIEHVRDTLAEDVRTGTSLGGFRKKLEERLEASPLGPARIETVYRTNVQAAFRDGRETLASNPIVEATFPYQEYIPIHDGRVRPEHEALGRLGLNGTGIYRRDDPVWDRFTPPWGFSCRCGARLLTVEQAAAAGVREAQRWLDSGRPPENPEWRIHAIPFPANPGFGSRGRTGVGIAA